jgi:tetratricopeptide (TPR) repeat protein
MRALIGPVVVVALLLCGACSSNKPEEQTGAVQGVSSKQATEMEAQRNAFERSEDPPITADTRFAAGQLAESQGNMPQAIAQYTEATQVNPRHPNAWYRLGVIYAQTRQFPQAIDAWQHYVRATNGAAAAYGNLGYCYELSGDRASAEEAFQTGVQRDPKNVQCRVNYGLMLARSGRENEALQQLSAVLKPAQAHYNLGSVYEQQGRKEMAKMHYKKAVQLSPDFTDAQNRLANIK